MPQQLAQYRIEQLLGEGTFAFVYRSVDERLHRQVALKILKPFWLNDRKAVENFKHEARIMARLHHPNIVVVYDVGEAEGSVYMAQFLVEGETLAERLERGPLPWTEMLAILQSVAAALDHAHGQGVVHRDVKPANILLDTGGQVYLSDFGLVQAAESSASISASTGGIVGTPFYMAPEQWREELGVTGAADVYALSCLVAEMLTGQVLFSGSTPATVMTKHLIDGPTMPEQWPADVPANIEAVLQRGLQREQAERFGTAGELVAALTDLSAVPVETAEPPRVEPIPVSSEPAPTPAPAAQPRSTNWLLFGGVAGGLLVVIVLGSLIYSAIGGGTGEPTPLSAAVSTPIPVVLANDTPTTVPSATNTPEPSTNTPTPAPTSTDTPKPPTNTPKPTPTPQITAAVDGAPMVLIPAGPFTMGSDSGRSDEQPAHEVTLDAFYIDQYEVTNARYADCVAAGACTLPGVPKPYYDEANTDHPVVWINWDQANTYCEWRDDRLPTEAEWEKAARGTDGRIYPWGNEWDAKQLNNVTSGTESTTPVGAYPTGASPYGVYDMAGNVWEWVADWYDGDYYATAPDHNPQGPAEGTKKVLRGGAWSYYDDYARASHRTGNTTDYNGFDYGFRCAAAAPE